jgi:hypothetical protein
MFGEPASPATSRFGRVQEGEDDPETQIRYVGGAPTRPGEDQSRTSTPKNIPPVPWHSKTEQRPARDRSREQKLDFGFREKDRPGLPGSHGARTTSRSKSRACLDQRKHFRGGRQTVAGGAASLLHELQPEATTRMQVGQSRMRYFGCRNLLTAGHTVAQSGRGKQNGGVTVPGAPAAIVQTRRKISSFASGLKFRQAGNFREPSICALPDGWWQIFPP